MKRIMVLLSALVLLHPLPLQAKTGGAVKDANPPTMTPAIPAYTACMSKITLSAKQKITYTKIKGIFPDLFCCSKLDTEKQSECRIQNGSTLQNFAKFLDQSINDPLSQKISGGSDGGNLDGEPVQPTDIDRILYQLDEVGLRFDEYQSLVEKAEGS